MGHPLALVHHIHHIHAGEGTEVERLPTRSGIERAPVEVDPAPMVRTVNDVGLEVTQVRIGVVQAMSHGYRIGVRGHARNRVSALPFPLADRELQALL